MCFVQLNGNTISLDGAIIQDSDDICSCSRFLVRSKIWIYCCTCRCFVVLMLQSQALGISAPALAGAALTSTPHFCQLKLFICLCISNSASCRSNKTIISFSSKYSTVPGDFYMSGGRAAFALGCRGLYTTGPYRGEPSDSRLATH